MITLALLNFILDLGSRFIYQLMGNLFSPMTQLTSYVNAFALPQTLIDIYSNVCYFLPMLTITTLLGFTVLIILAKSFIALVHFLPGLIFGG